MKKQDVIRAWRNPNYRRSLSAEEKAQLPAHPAEWMVGVEDDVLAGVTGGCCMPPMSAACTPCPPLHCY